MKEDQEDQKLVNQSQGHRAFPSSESQATSKLKAFRDYKTREREVLRLDHVTLLSFIKDVEEAHFRTEHDTGANRNALFIWSLVRRLAGLPDLALTDLPAWCVACKKYHQYPHERKPVTSDESGN